MQRHKVGATGGLPVVSRGLGEGLGQVAHEAAARRGRLPQVAQHGARRGGQAAVGALALQPAAGRLIRRAAAVAVAPVLCALCGSAAATGTSQSTL